MSWVRLDDAMPHHPKIVAAGATAFALDVAAICYSNRYELDGFIADTALAAVLPGLAQPRKVAARLVQAGRWHRDDNAGGWRIHDVTEYQFSADEAERRRSTRAEAGRKGGLASGRSRRSKSEAQAKQMLPESFKADEPRPDPTRPDPSIELDTSTTEHTPSGAPGVDRVALAIEIETERRLDDRRSKGVEIGDPGSYAAAIRTNVVREMRTDLEDLATRFPAADPEGLLDEIAVARFLA